MESQKLFLRYQQLRQYVGWRAEDAGRIQTLGPLLKPHYASLVDDFYEEIKRHPDAFKVITGGVPQIERLKGTLITWLEQLMSGVYDADYVYRRWKIGYRHVEIGLDQVFTNVALSRLRRGLLRVLDATWQGTMEDLLEARAVLNTLIDLDLALIEDAYQTEYTLRQQASERLALIGQVAGGIAHELRNPLNVVKTSAYYLLNAKNPTHEKTATHLARIERQVAQAEEVIAALVRFAKMPLPDFQSVGVKELLGMALAGIECPVEVTTFLECPDELTAVADAGQIRIVLDNLIRNALEAMPEGGHLILKASLRRPYAQIEVIDTGHGIEPERLKRIMEPFYSTKARGIGLGLAMAKAILEKNNGRISATSEVSAGTTFVIRLKSVA
jgi:signal transduction histidine kinase